MVSSSPYLPCWNSEAIKKALGYDLSPALYSAEAKVIELPSGTSSAKFLMSTNQLFIVFSASCGDMEKSILRSSFHLYNPLQIMEACVYSRPIDIASRWRWNTWYLRQFYALER